MSGEPVMWILFVLIAWFFLSRTSGLPGVAPISAPINPIGPAQPSGGVAPQTSLGGTSNGVFGNSGATQNGLDAPIANNPGGLVSAIPTGTQICPVWGCNINPVQIKFPVNAQAGNLPAPVAHPIATHPLLITGLLRTTPSTL